MTSLKDMKIGTKLIGVFAVLMIMFAAGMAVTLMVLSETSDDMEELYQREFKIVQVSKDLQRNIQGLAKNLSRTCVAALNAEGRGDHAADRFLDEKIAATRKSLEDIKSNIDTLNGCSVDDRDTLSIISDNFPALTNLSNQILSQYDSGNVTAGVRLAAGGLDDYAVKIGVAADKLAVGAASRASAKYENTQMRVRRAQVTSIIICILLLAASVVFCAAMTRGIVKPLTTMETAAKRLAGGDLSQEISYESKNELGSLAASLRDTIASLNSYIAEIKVCLESVGDGKLNYKSRLDFKGDFAAIKSALDDISENLTRAMVQINVSAEQVTSGAEQIAGSAQALSQATIEQASSVEELSATINDVSDRVRENADNAVASSRITESVGRDVEKSGADVQALSQAMTEMKEMSGRITGIIRDIEDIAFQTNILSLNAAVEAARAGEAGRGFSVVANEIRRLSAKTTEASKSTSELIGKAVEMMVHGSDMADDTSRKLLTVVSDARNAAERVRAISIASNDQASAVVQLRESIEQISSVVQENSATAEESAASSEELTGQMQMLKRLVDSFEFDRQRA